ncbi:MAG: hypothetical protein ACLQIB_53650 [Isosphaeraceae bacterium]
MDRVERIRGKIFQDEHLVLDQIDGFLKSHEKQGRTTFYGTIELGNDQSKLLNPVTSYRLVLADGRKGNFYVEIVPSNVQGKSIAEFHVTGGFKK